MNTKLINHVNSTSSITVQSFSHLLGENIYVPFKFSDEVLIIISGGPWHLKDVVDVLTPFNP